MTPLSRFQNWLAMFLLLAFAQPARAGLEVMCTYAPSQNSGARALLATTAGAAAAAKIILKSAGLAVVPHSSGLPIFTGSAGYVAGTIGGASAIPFIYQVVMVAGAAALTVELLCAASKTHREAIVAAAREFHGRMRNETDNLSSRVRDAAEPKLQFVSAHARKIISGAIDYAYRR